MAVDRVSDAVVDLKNPVIRSRSSSDVRLMTNSRELRSVNTRLVRELDAERAQRIERDALGLHAIHRVQDDPRPPCSATG